MVRQRSPMASAAGWTRGGARTNPAASPAAAPMSVSMIRPVAAVFAPVTDRMSIALMGTSRMAIAQAQRVADGQRDHDRDSQAPPGEADHADKPTASSTPATTAATRCTALRSVSYRLTWATSSAVSGASTGRGVTGSGSATR